MNIIAKEAITVGGDNLMLDQLIWRRYQQDMPGLLETLLNLPENAHLESEAAVLKPGTVVTMPVVAPREPDVVDVVSLWD